MSSDLARYLRPTPFIDFDHPSVAAFAREATAGARTERERAVAAFHAVRDGVRYDPYTCDLSRESMMASTAVARRRAFCIPKAVLLAATLRIDGIPARLGFADVTNHLSSSRLVELLRTDLFAFHGYVEAWLDGRWVKATPAFDAALCAVFGVPPLDWDGETDAILQAHDGTGRRFMEYRRDRGVHDDVPYDELVRAWRELYPHFFEDGAPQAVSGDLAGEAAAEGGGRPSR